MTKPAVLGSRGFRAGLVVVLVAVAVLAVQVVRVPAPAARAARHYVRSSSTRAAALPKGVQEIGETPGGGELFGPRHVTLEGDPEGPINPTVIWVRDDDGRVWTYALVGGP